MEGGRRLQNRRDLGVCVGRGAGGDRNRAACLEGRSESAGRAGVLLNEGHVAQTHRHTVWLFFKSKNRPTSSASFSTVFFFFFLNRKKQKHTKYIKKV